MSPTLSLIVGFSIAAVFILSWLSGIAILRRRKAAMVPDTVAEEIAGTAADVHSIEGWLARAAALPDGAEPRAAEGERDQGALHEFAERHFPELTEPHPHLHLLGITGVEKRLVTWVCAHTGLPNPFDLLERFTGDPDDIRRAAETWKDAHADMVRMIDELCVAIAALHETWEDPEADRFFAILADYMAELDALTADVQGTAETLSGLQAEAALVEGTVVGLINVLVGSLGGYLVEAVATAGTLTPAVAAQAQIELTWVLKQIARALSRLPGIYANAKKILTSVSGFRQLDQEGTRFQLAAIRKIASSIDSVG